MSMVITRRSLLLRFLPFFEWLPLIGKTNLRPDLEAGLIGAVLILPQSIALATLAGMPPEYGIYTSIFPVVVASLWGSSWHALSGPNTAVCVMIAAAVAPFASIGSLDYIGFVLSLTLMVGVIQLVIGISGLGGVLNFISQTVIDAIVLAVALVIIVSAGASLFGLLSNLDEPFLVRLYQLVHDIERANPFAVAIGAITVASGFIAKHFFRRYALVIAVFVGAISGYLINLAWGPANTGIELLGRLSLSLLPFSSPSFDLDSMYVLKELLTAAFAIAFLGLMQAIVIARSLGTRSGQRIETSQEIVGQGLSNMVAPFFSCFAGSGSFNRSAAHYDAGAQTPMAAIWASVLLALAVFFGAPLIVYLPMPAVAGALILVGWGLLDFSSTKRVLGSRTESAIFYTTFIAALVLGLNSGVFTGLAISLVIYLWFASKPNLFIERQIARDGRSLATVTIDGNLFFGSQNYVEGHLNSLGKGEEEPIILLLKTDHLTYLDIPAISMIAAEARRRRDTGGDLYLYTFKEEILKLLHRSGYLAQIGSDHIIERDKDHPMKEVLMPYRLADETEAKEHSPEERFDDHPRENFKLVGYQDVISVLVERLRQTQLFGSLRPRQLIRLLERSELEWAESGKEIIEVGQTINSYLLLVQGELEGVRYWHNDVDVEQSYSRRMSSHDPDTALTFFESAGRQHYSARAITPVRFLRIDMENLDEMIEWNQQLSLIPEGESELRRRMALVKKVGLFQNLPMETVIEAFRRMHERQINAGDTAIRQGDVGDSYYLIAEGEAEVLRKDQFSDAISRVSVIRSGDSFGAEALLQGGNRNATVRMLTPGTLLRLDKTDFDELLRSKIVNHLSAESVWQAVQQGNVTLIDCRYEPEFNQSRIPGALLAPVDQLRDMVGQLDRDRHYVVYCRNGSRSQVAAFLLRQHHMQAHALAGGIRDWPYDLDVTPRQ